MSDIARLTVALYANSAQFVADLEKSKGKAKDWSGKVGGYFSTVATTAGVMATAAVGSLALIYNQQSQIIDQNAKLADSLGMTMEAYTQLKYAADLTGAGDAFNGAMESMVVKMGEASFGGGEAKEALDMLGLSAHKLGKMTPEQQILALSDALQKVENQSQRTFITDQIFGGPEMMVLLNQGSAGIKALTKEADSLGVTLSRVDAAKVEMANDALYKLNVGTTALKQQITTELAPIVAAMADEFRKYSAEQGGMNNMIANGIQIGVTGAGYIGDALRGVNLIIKGMDAGVTSLKYAFVSMGQPVAEVLHFIGATIFKLITSPLLAAMKVAGAFDDDIAAMADRLEAFGNMPAPQLFDSVDANNAKMEMSQAIWDLQNLAAAPLPSQGIEDWFNATKLRINQAAELYAGSINRNGKGKGNGIEAGKNPDVIAYQKGTADLQQELQRRLALQAAGDHQAAIQEAFAYQDRYTQLSVNFQKAYAAAESNQTLQAQLENQYFADREAIYQIHQANLTDIQKAEDEKRKAYQQATAQELMQFSANAMAMTTNMLKQAGMEHTGVYKALFAMQQAAAIPSMIVATEEAATKALAAFPGPAGIALSQATRVMGYTSVGIAAGQAIGGMAHSGITEVPREGTWLLDKGERVYTNRSAQQLDQMYSAIMSGGGGGAGNIEQHFHISGTRDAELEQMLRAAAMEGARMGYQQVMGDMRSNGPIKRMSRS